MGMSAGGGGGTQSQPSYKTKGHKLERSLVIEEVKLIEVEKRVDVPKFVVKEVEQTKYVTKEEPTTKYKVEEKDTTKYNVLDRDTIKYKVKEEPTLKFIPKEVSVERPVPVPVEYEKPVVKEKIIEIVKHNDVAAMQQYLELVIKVKQELEALSVSIDKIRKYKLVEEIIKVPKIEWVSTPVERIVWKDVERERP